MDRLDTGRLLQLGRTSIAALTEAADRFKLIQSRPSCDRILSWDGARITEHIGRKKLGEERRAGAEESTVRVRWAPP
jgi:hypothetical protein